MHLCEMSQPAKQNYETFLDYVSDSLKAREETEWANFWFDCADQTGGGGGSSL